MDPTEHGGNYSKIWATTAVLNAGLDGPTIDANNGWWKVDAAKGKMPRYLMMQRYAQVLQDLRHQLIFWGGFKGKGRRGVLECSTKVLACPLFSCLEMERREIM
jgi:hypothetical protein